jgi:hypothetical protein
MTIDIIHVEKTVSQPDIFQKNAPRIIIYPKCTGDNNAKIKQEIQIGMGLLSRPPQSYKIQRSLQEV